MSKKYNVQVMRFGTWGNIYDNNMSKREARTKLSKLKKQKKFGDRKLRVKKVKNDT